VATFLRWMTRFLGSFSNVPTHDKLKSRNASPPSPFDADDKSERRVGVAVPRDQEAVGQAKQLYHDDPSNLWLEQAAQNFRYALRRLCRSPGFTITAVVILALGIGATAAMFSLIDGILLRPLPFSRPDQLVLLGDHLGKGLDLSVTAREIGEYSRATGAFSSVGGFAPRTYELSGGPTPEVVHAARLTAGVFPTLGVQPVLGRIFTQQEEDSRQQVAVISYSLWTSRFHRDSRVLGESIELDRKPYSVVGVMPRSFEFPLLPGSLGQAQLWVPMSLTAEELSDEATGAWGYQLVARLKDGIALSQAAQDADRVARQIMRDFPASISSIQIRGDVMPLREHTVASVQPILRTLFLAVSVVLLIACVNVAVLLLVRAIQRRREYAVRLALGARFSAIFGESLLEGLLLSLSGGALGILLAAVAIHTALHLLPQSLPRIDSVSMNATVALFALLLALGTGILCSLAPAFAVAQTNLLDSLKSASLTGTQTKSHARLRSALVILEITIALVLLIASGAFLRSYQKMLAIDPGFRPDHVLVGGYQLPSNEYPTDSSVDIFDRAIIERLQNQPGVTAVGITTALPASASTAASGYTIEGEPASQWKLKFANFAIVYGDYFRALGIPLIGGRYFTRDDGANSPLVVIINESMAKHCWPGQNAIGKRFHAGNPRRPYPWATVVGVVADTKPHSLDQPGADQWYAPIEQPATLFGSVNPGTRTLPGTGYITLRSIEPPEQMIQTLRSAVGAIDPQLALSEVQTMDDVISNVEAPRRFNTFFVSAFTIGALVLAITGIYAVVAFSVTLRIQELAIRMALGAQPLNIARLIVFSGVKLAIFGCTVGVVVSLMLSRLIRSFLFEVSPLDPAIYTAGVLIMILIAVLASVVPATRAALTRPTEALRSI